MEFRIERFDAFNYVEKVTKRSRFFANEEYFMGGVTPIDEWFTAEFGDSDEKVNDMRVVIRDSEEMEYILNDRTDDGYPYLLIRNRFEFDTVVKIANTLYGESHEKLLALNAVLDDNHWYRFCIKNIFELEDYTDALGSVYFYEDADALYTETLPFTIPDEASPYFDYQGYWENNTKHEMNTAYFLRNGMVAVWG